MVKQSKRNRRRMHQAGMGGGFTVVRRVPVRVQRGLLQAPTSVPKRTIGSSAWSRRPGPA